MGQADLGGGDIALLWIIGKLVATFAHFLNFSAFLSRIVFVWPIDDAWRRFRILWRVRHWLSSLSGRRMLRFC